MPEERPKNNWDWPLVAKRFSERRALFGWTVDELAQRSGVSRDTIMRVEKGRPCRDKSLHALRGTLSLFSAQLVAAPSEYKHFSSCPANRIRWMAATHRDHKGRPVKDIDYSFVDDPAERKRRASLGYQRFFSGFIRAELDGGVMSSGLMEIYQESWVDQHFGEEFIYCLSGEALISVEDESCVLHPGDSMVFDALKKHRYAPNPGAARPAVILFVVATRPNEGERLEAAIPPRNQWGI